MDFLLNNNNNTLANNNTKLLRWSIHNRKYIYALSIGTKIDYLRWPWLLFLTFGEFRGIWQKPPDGADGCCSLR